MHLLTDIIYNQSEVQDNLFVYRGLRPLAFKNYMQLALTEEKLCKTRNRSLSVRFSFYKLSKNKYGARQKAAILEFPFANM